MVCCYVCFWFYLKGKASSENCVLYLWRKLCFHWHQVSSVTPLRKTLCWAVWNRSFPDAWYCSSPLDWKERPSPGFREDMVLIPSFLCLCQNNRFNITWHMSCLCYWCVAVNYDWDFNGYFGAAAKRISVLVKFLFFMDILVIEICSF